MHPLRVGTNTFAVTVIAPIMPGLSDINNPDEVITTDYTIIVTREGSFEDDSDSEPAPTPEPTPAEELDDVPKTGEDFRTGLWFVLMLIGIVTLKAGAAMWHQSKKDVDGNALK